MFIGKYILKANVGFFPLLDTKTSHSLFCSCIRQQRGRDQVFNIKKATIVRLFDPFPKILSFIRSTDTLPALSLSSSFMAISVKYSLNSFSYLSNNFCKLFPIMREIWCLVRKPSSKELMPFRIAVSFYSGVLRREMLMILMNCYQLMKSPKQQMFFINYSPGFMSSPFNPTQKVQRSTPFSMTYWRLGVLACLSSDIFSKDLQRLQRLQISKRLRPYFSMRQGMFCVLSKEFFLSSCCSKSLLETAASMKFFFTLGCEAYWTKVSLRSCYIMISSL